MPEKKVKVWGETADGIVYGALYMTWDEPLCQDVNCKCTNSARWRMARAIEAVREFEISNRSESARP